MITDIDATDRRILGVLQKEGRITNALNSGYARLDDLVWGHRPSLAEAIDIIRTHHGLI